MLSGIGRSYKMCNSMDGEARESTNQLELLTLILRELRKLNAVIECDKSRSIPLLLKQIADNTEKVGRAKQNGNS